MKRLHGVLILLCVAGCGTSSDPAKDFKSRLSKLVRNKEEVRCVKDVEGVEEVLRLADPDAYRKIRIPPPPPPPSLTPSPNPAPPREPAGPSFDTWLQKKQVWYKVRYATDCAYDVRKTDSLVTPLLAEVTLTCHVSCSNLLTTKEAAEKRN